MALFSREEICRYMLEGKSDLMKTLFNCHSEHISIKCVGASVAVGKRQTKHTTRYVVHSSTRIERELKGGRIQFIDIEEYKHEHSQ